MQLSHFCRQITVTEESEHKTHKEKSELKHNDSLPTQLTGTAPITAQLPKAEACSKAFGRLA